MGPVPGGRRPARCDIVRVLCGTPPHRAGPPGAQNRYGTWDASLFRTRCATEPGRARAVFGAARLQASLGIAKTRYANLAAFAVVALVHRDLDDGPRGADPGRDHLRHLHRGEQHDHYPGGDDRLPGGEAGRFGGLRPARASSWPRWTARRPPRWSPRPRRSWWRVTAVSCTWCPPRRRRPRATWRSTARAWTRPGRWCGMIWTGWPRAMSRPRARFCCTRPVTSGAAPVRPSGRRVSPRPAGPPPPGS